MASKILRLLALGPLALLLSGCNLVIMNPSGDVAAQQRDLIVWSTVLMLIIIVPVILLTLFFAWRYRQSNTSATYDPDWHHSTRLEVIIWSAPLCIIVALGGLTWVGSHLLDPYRPIARLDAERPLPADVKPLQVDVVALDWKWLFLYPEQGVASVNELALPVDVPVKFNITASTVMNAFSVPAMAGMIYAMPGMQTQLHAVINKPGVYHGLSANYSGGGFSDMHFKVHGLSTDDFNRWVADAKANNTAQLGRAEYLELEKPSHKEPVRHFASFAPDLFNAVVNRCVDASRMCMDQMMGIDMRGGLGMAGTINVLTSPEPTPSGKPQRYVAAFCTFADARGTGQPAQSRAIN
ncbi:ubiquinol oxidase subunit II [Pseudoroseomonas wenyumeiae]|uniref:Ubiquinol oxidase subunit 2 n=2 Tax=Teichococcus wenyumeiae TaxID=2478470 RepID=A0A3A9JPJ7_9PROT|nr:ubiquinol oxidase subunit II [Pseudoroseomonas wenyumeiae]RKK05764.1 ubiquinol oxidase subunit II [Pseudoroseomonas wenyumeiae]RMI24978.1 ubiquinol oxidase subunit II [Pseudoroseomonas wenyumeiae]